MGKLTYIIFKCELSIQCYAKSAVKVWLGNKMDDKAIVHKTVRNSNRKQIVKAHNAVSSHHSTQIQGDFIKSLICKISLRL